MKTCAFDDCGRPARGRGWCAAHLRQVQRGTTPRALVVREKPASPMCTFEGCTRPHKAKGLCLRHRQQQIAGVTLRPLSRVVSGNRNGRAKLDPQRIKAIREAAESGRWSQAALAEIQGVHRATVGLVTRGETWKQEGRVSPGDSCTERLWRTSSSSARSGPSTSAARTRVSPYLLVQEHPVVQARPWRVLLACALCNRTKGRRALPILIDIVTRWPRAEDLAEARSADLEPLLRPLGLQRVRADRIVAMCRSIVRRGIHLLPYRHRDVRDIPGVGRYAQDAWSLFVIGRTDIEPRDKELAKWLHWRKQAAG